MIEKIHTGHLTGICPKRVELTAKGYSLREVPSAMFRGTMWHNLVGALHGGEATNEPNDTLAYYRKEGRTVTAAAIASADETLAELHELLEEYKTRVLPLVPSDAMQMVEVPIRGRVELMDKTYQFASHIDLLIVHPGSSIEVWDWKTGVMPQSQAERSHQLALYCALLSGFSGIGQWSAELYCNPYGLGLDYVETRAERVTCAIVRVDNLKKYKKKTTLGDGTVMAAGESRPLSSIVTRLGSVTKAWEQEAIMRLRMMDRGMYPAIAGEHCTFCDCRAACPTFLPLVGGNMGVADGK